jgi:hypothetical protein
MANTPFDNLNSGGIEPPRIRTENVKEIGEPVHGNRLERRLVSVLVPVLLASLAVAALDGNFVVC